MKVPNKFAIRATIAKISINPGSETSVPNFQAPDLDRTDGLEAVADLAVGGTEIVDDGAEVIVDPTDDVV